MGSIHSTRILRFLLVLGCVVLTIFIYASYSSNTSLAPPPRMRASGGSASPATGERGAAGVAAALYQQPTLVNKTSSGDRSVGGSVEEVVFLGEAVKVDAPSSSSDVVAVNSIQRSHNTHNKKSVAANFAKKQTHYREPTIDEDARGGGPGGGDGVGTDAAGTIGAGVSPNGSSDDALLTEEAALERFGSNDFLEEQYVQNVDSLLAGNINNSSPAVVVQSPPLLSTQLQQQQHQAQKKQQQPRQNQSVDNNAANNKILDSDVLIPTSNLQKFIENADKILRNITAMPPARAAPPAPPSKAVKKGAQQQPAKPQPQPSSVAADDDGIALPPSAVMTIKRASSSGAAEPPAAAITTKKAAAHSPPLKNSTALPAPPVDPSQGIQTQQIYESGHMNEELNIEKLCPNRGADLKLLILITSAQAHADARLAIRQTWAHYGTRRDVSTAFVLGRSTNESLNLALTQENFIYGDLIRGQFIDSYNNLTLKTVSALEWVDQHCPRAQYILKTDDDMFINVPKLLSFLDAHRSKERRVIYGRLAKKWKPIRNKKSKYYVSTGQFSSPVFPPFTTGPAYVMTSDCVHELYTRALHQVYLKLEDVFTTGIVAQQLGIKRVHANEFLNRRIAFNPCNIRKAISVHMIKSNEQFDLWKKLLDQSTKCK